MHRRGLLIAASAALASAAVSVRAQTPAPTPAAAPMPVVPATPPPPGPVTPPPELEAVRSAIIGRHGLIIRLVSHGCTHKADIASFVERRAGVTTVAFGRKRIEMCGRGRASEIALDFSFKDLGIDPDEPVVVLNPLLAAGGKPQADRRQRR